jgi:23S rRNA pseudouridine1911/1915/1917 synthase
MKNAHSLEVLFEDQWIIVINKPSGMLSVGYPGYHGKSAQDILFDMHRSKGKVRIAAVHRIDRDTSGVMMFARTADAKAEIMDGWQEIVGERTYRCVCARVPGAEPLPDSGTIDEPIAYNRYDVGFVPRKGDRAALKDAEKAVTHFKVIERGSLYDLVECELETGRKNQIRVHMAHLGHPVAGDETYGKPLYDEGAWANPIDRLALHARVLAFTHPFTGVVQRFEVNEDESFVRLVRAGKKSASTRKTGDATTSASDEKQPRRRSSRPVGPGKAERPGERGKSKPFDRDERDDRRSAKRESIDSLSDLKPVPGKRSTKQERGQSKFIPKK